MMTLLGIVTWAITIVCVASFGWAIHKDQHTDVALDPKHPIRVKNTQALFGAFTVAVLMSWATYIFWSRS